MTLWDTIFEYLQVSAEKVGYFDFCKDVNGEDLKCDLLTIRSAQSVRSINKAGHIYEHGNCNNVMGLHGTDDEVIAKIHQIINKLNSSNPPFKLKEDYFTCSMKQTSAILQSIPLSASMIQSVSAVYLLVFLPLLLWLMSNCASGRKLMRYRYRAEELKAASTELALHLLRARDNDTLGIVEKGTLENLSRELLMASLITSGYVDDLDSMNVDKIKVLSDSIFQQKEKSCDGDDNVRYSVNGQETVSAAGAGTRSSKRHSALRFVQGAMRSGTIGNPDALEIIRPNQPESGESGSQEARPSLQPPASSRDRLFSRYISDTGRPTSDNDVEEGIEMGNAESTTTSDNHVEEGIDVGNAELRNPLHEDQQGFASEDDNVGTL